MATVHVGVGQCGVQISRYVWRLAEAEYGATGPLFDADGAATCVLVDSEPKVVRSVTDSASEWFLPCVGSHDVLWEQAGRGNNWAWGYYGTHRQATARTSKRWTGVTEKALSVGELETARHKLRRRALERIRRKFEACDRVQSVVISHSTGGGTGAGLGSRLVEDVRDAFPSVWSVASAVTPFRGGEAPLQNYNSLLTLAKLQESADAVLLFSNDDLLEQAAKLTRSASHKGAASSTNRVTMHDMNAVAASALAGLLFPVTKPTRGLRTPLYDSFDAGGLVSELCPLPSLKLLELRSSPGLASTPRAVRQPRKPTESTGAAGAGGRTSKLAAAHRAARTGRKAAGRSAAVAHVNWEDAARSLSRSMAKHDGRQRPVVRLAGRVVARGVDSGANAPATSASAARLAAKSAMRRAAPRSVETWAGDTPPELEDALARFVDPVHVAPRWDRGGQAAAVPLQLSGGHALACAGIGRSLTSVANTTAPASHVAEWTAKARSMYDAKAFLHWFTEHGCEVGVFDHAFEVVDSVVASYDDQR